MSLKDIYDEHIKVDKSEQEKYNTKMVRIIEEMVHGMRRESPILRAIYSKVYYGGSHWDYLQVGTSRQECDVNVCFDLSKIGEQVHLLFDRLSIGKENFAYIYLSSSKVTEIIADICEWNPDFNAYYISPILLFKTFVEAGKSFLSECQYKLEVDIATEGRFVFEASYKIGAPWTVTFKNPGLQDIEIDFVPAIILSTDQIRGSECEERLHFISSRIQKETKNETEFLGICLHKAEASKFEMDFHNWERSILYKKKFAKNVIKLIKFMRNNNKGPIELLSSHIIKTVVMEKTLEDENYWSENFNLEKNFLDCLVMLMRKIKSGKVADIFFPSVNLLEVKFKDAKAKRLLTEAIVGIKEMICPHCNECPCCNENHNRTIAFFGEICLFCFDVKQGKETKNIKKHILKKHRWTKHSSDQLAVSCTNKLEMEKILQELRIFSIAEREKVYKCNFCRRTFVCDCRLVDHIRSNHQSQVSNKRVICPHCLAISSSKCNLLKHIYNKHEVFRPAAALALQDKRH